MATLVATDLLLLAHSQFCDRTRFFKSWLRRIAPDTHLDQACGLTAFANSPGGVAIPEELKCRHASKGFVTFTVVADPLAPILLWLTWRAIRLYCKLATTI
jgi:hypothetical protein